MTLKSRLALTTILAIGMGVALAGPAKAGLITALDTVVNNGNGTYTYNYTSTLTIGSELQGTATTYGASSQTPVKQFGTIYDFGPIVGGAVTFATTTNNYLSDTGYFQFTYENVSTPQSLNTTVPDSPTLANVRYTYIDTNTLFRVAGDTNASGLNGTADAVTIQPGVGNLGTFSVTSVFAPGSTNNLAYDSSTINSDNFTAQGNNGLINGPSVPTAVPEPASLAVLGMGLLGLGLARRRNAA